MLRIGSIEGLNEHHYKFVNNRETGTQAGKFTEHF